MHQRLPESAQSETRATRERQCRKRGNHRSSIHFTPPHWSVNRRQLIAGICICSTALRFLGDFCGLCPLYGLSRRNLLPPSEPLCDFLLEAERTRLVELCPPEFIRQVLLRDVRLRNLVCVLVPLVVAQFLHQLRRGVPDVHRNGLRGSLSRGLHCRVQRPI